MQFYLQRCIFKKINVSILCISQEKWVLNETFESLLPWSKIAFKFQLACLADAEYYIKFKFLMFWLVNFPIQWLIA
jgi:hypothetical protein